MMRFAIVAQNRKILRTVFALTTLVSLQAAYADEHYFGKVRNVSDGDTFTMVVDGKDIRVRLCGVDSPERGQPGYGQAAGGLSRLIEGKDVACIQVGGGTPCDGRSKRTNRDRIVAQCFIGDKDIGMEMACAATAKDMPEFSAGHYAVCRH